MRRISTPTAERMVEGGFTIYGVNISKPGPPIPIKGHRDLTRRSGNLTPVVHANPGIRFYCTEEDFRAFRNLASKELDNTEKNNEEVFGEHEASKEILLTKERPLKPMVYVAGPIKSNPHGCVRDVMPFFDELLKLGFVPFLPQLSVISDMVKGRTWAEWLDYDLDVILSVDCLFRLPGHSLGADLEVEFAIKNNVPVLNTFNDADRFIEAWRVMNAT